MDPDKYRDVGVSRTTFILKGNEKHKKGKQAKNWETQYKKIWNGRKR